MRDGLIVLFCADTHELTILLIAETITESGQLATVMMPVAREIIYDGEDSIIYEDILLIRNSNKA